MAVRCGLRSLVLVVGTTLKVECFTVYTHARICTHRERELRFRAHVLYGHFPVTVSFVHELLGLKSISYLWLICFIDLTFRECKRFAVRCYDHQYQTL